jgi:hypothetical protein
MPETTISFLDDMMSGKSKGVAATGRLVHYSDDNITSDRIFQLYEVL